jgi:hypothetical protein
MVRGCVVESKLRADSGLVVAGEIVNLTTLAYVLLNEISILRTYLL